MIEKPDVNNSKELKGVIAHLTLRCPVNNREVSADKWQEMTIIVDEDQAVWWRCPECGGWHIILADNQSKK
jgi:predicted RNA-binding Zn-ribbon protein involved in translation (DUF1610 family)